MCSRSFSGRSNSLTYLVNSYSEKLEPLDTTSHSTPVDVDELELSHSALGARYGRGKTKTDGGDVEMKELR